jgi:PIN domain nuclease of toxin-antitoxin system
VRTSLVTDSYVVDTHALIWYLEGNSRLGDAARLALADPDSRLFLPIIALAEACWIVEHGRSRIPTVTHLLEHVDADPRILLVPLDRSTVDHSLSLTTIGEMHDRQIVASARQLIDAGDAVALINRDASIQLSGLVPTLW